MFRSCTVTSIILNKKINNIIKIAESLEEFGLLIEYVSETIKNEAEEQKKIEFLGMSLGSLSASLLRNLLTGKGTIRADEKTFRAGERFFRAGQDY